MTEFHKEGEPVTGAHIVIDDFLPHDMALSMRADIDAHFAEPMKHHEDTHQVWNYWYVAELYTYLRTRPEKVIARDKVEKFAWTLRDWCFANIGLGSVYWPHLSLYTPGCRQNLHNDALNGRYAYVYSLTNNVRRTEGGGTIILKEGDPTRANLTRSMTVQGISDKVEPVFNRLVLFDDRMIHGVETVTGSMDPAEGRFVLHGHIEDNGPVAVGALSYEELQPVIQAGLSWFSNTYVAELARYHGPFCVKFGISPAGVVDDIRVLLDRVVPLVERDTAEWPGLRARYLASLQSIRFPVAADRTVISFPIVFAGPGTRSAA